MNTKVNEIGVRHPGYGRQSFMGVASNHRERLKNLSISCGLPFNEYTIL